MNIQNDVGRWYYCSAVPFAARAPRIPAALIEKKQMISNGTRRQKVEAEKRTDWCPHTALSPSAIHADLMILDHSRGLGLVLEMLSEGALIRGATQTWQGYVTGRTGVSKTTVVASSMVVVDRTATAEA